MRAALLAVLLVASTASAAPDPTGEVLLDGSVRPGRPVVVRVRDAVRVRSAGTAWASPRGTGRTEFVLHGAFPEGDALVVEAEPADGGPAVTLRLPARPLPATGRVVAVLSDPPPRVGTEPVEEPGVTTVRVQATGLPTVPEAWFVFDEVVRVPDGLHVTEVAALLAWQERRESPREPALWAPSPRPWSGMASVAARAPTLPDDVGRDLLLLAATLGVLLLIVSRSRRPTPAARAAWLVGPALAAAGWFVLADRLPGPLRAHTAVLVGDGDAVLVLRVHALRDGTARFLAPGAVPLRFEAGDAGADGLTLGDEAVVRLEAGDTRLLAFPWRAGAEIEPYTPPPRPAPFVAWCRDLGGEPGGDSSQRIVAPALDARGTRVVRVGEWVLR